MCFSHKDGLSSVAIFAFWRLTQREDIVPEDCGDFVVMAASPLSASLNADVDLTEIEAAARENAEDIQTSFQELVDDLENPDTPTSTEEK